MIDTVTALKRPRAGNIWSAWARWATSAASRRSTPCAIRAMRASSCAPAAGWSWAKCWPRRARVPTTAAPTVRSCAALTVEDQLLAARLEKNRQAAYEACAARLTAINSPAVLMDVEHLFDGQTLVVLLPGRDDARVGSAHATELAELYETHVQFRRFAEAVDDGCGPGCGTEAAAGCKTCVSGCAVASACPTRAHSHN